MAMTVRRARDSELDGRQSREFDMVRPRFSRQFVRRPMPGKNSTYNLEERLLNYAAAIIRLVETMPRTRSATHVGGQLLRSGTSPLFNHGEAQSAESREDFIHKLKVCLKELHETNRGLKLIMRVPLVKDPESVFSTLIETDELVRIFSASIKTAKSRTGEDHLCS
jgi:four helix bundle protein